MVSLKNDFHFWVINSPCVADHNKLQKMAENNKLWGFSALENKRIIVTYHTLIALNLGQRETFSAVK